MICPYCKSEDCIPKYSYARSMKILSMPCEEHPVGNYVATLPYKCNTCGKSFAHITSVGEIPGFSQVVPESDTAQDYPAVAKTRLERICSKLENKTKKDFHEAVLEAIQPYPDMNANKTKWGSTKFTHMYLYSVLAYGNRVQMISPDTLFKIMTYKEASQGKTAAADTGCWNPYLSWKSAVLRNSWVDLDFVKSVCASYLTILDTLPGECSEYEGAPAYNAKIPLDLLDSYEVAEADPIMCGPIIAENIKVYDVEDFLYDLKDVTIVASNWRELYDKIVEALPDADVSICGVLFSVYDKDTNGRAVKKTEHKYGFIVTYNPTDGERPILCKVVAE